MVDAVVHHWVFVMTEGAEERGGRGQEDRHHNVLFYANDGMVAFSDPRWLQGTFITVVGLSDRVVLWTNAGKTVGMIFCSCQAAGTHLELAYGQRMTGEVPSYQEQQKVRVQCKECGEDMALG